MFLLIMSEVIVGEAPSQQRRLAEGQAKTSSRDGIDSAGSVTNQGDIAEVNARQPSADGDRAPLGGGNFGMAKERLEFGKICQRGIEAQMRIGADECEADFVRADGRYIDLAVIDLAVIDLAIIDPAIIDPAIAAGAVIGPIQLHKLGWGSDAIVAAKSETSRMAPAVVEAGPAANKGIGTICADNPARGRETIREMHASRLNPGDGCSPKQRHPAGSRVIDKDAMQSRAADSEGRASREVCFGSLASAHKANALEGMARARRNGDAEVVQRSDTVGHEALATRLVDGRNRAISDGNAEPTTARRDRCGEARRTSADDEDVDWILRVQFSSRSPFKKDEFRTEAWPHGREHTQCARSGTAILHHFFEHHQNGSRRQVTGPA